MKITTGAEAWWSGVDNKVRTGISTWRVNAGTEIKKEFMSKFYFCQAMTHFLTIC